MFLVRPKQSTTCLLQSSLLRSLILMVILATRRCSRLSKPCYLLWTQPIYYHKLPQSIQIKCLPKSQHVFSPPLWDYNLRLRRKFIIRDPQSNMNMLQKSLNYCFIQVGSNFFYWCGIIHRLCKNFLIKLIRKTRNQGLRIERIRKKAEGRKWFHNLNIAISTSLSTVPIKNLHKNLTKKKND